MTRLECGVAGARVKDARLVAGQPQSGRPVKGITRERSLAPPEGESQLATTPGIPSSCFR